MSMKYIWNTSDFGTDEYLINQLINSLLYILLTGKAFSSYPFFLTVPSESLLPDIKPSHIITHRLKMLCDSPLAYG